MMLLEVVVALSIWWLLGGWACRRLSPDTPDGMAGGLLVGCLVLGPFCAGVAIAEMHKSSKAEPVEP